MHPLSDLLAEHEGWPAVARGPAGHRHWRSPRRQVRLPPAINAQLDTYAKAHDTPASEVIRGALDAFLERHR